MNNTTASPHFSAGGTENGQSATPEKHSSVIAQQIGYYILVAALVAVGVILGYELGNFLVNAARAAPPAAPFLMGDYHTVVANPFLAGANIVGFTLIGGLLAFLLASVVFKRIIGIGEAVSVMTANEKIAVFIGIVGGLLITIMVAQITLRIQTPPIGLPLTILIGVVLVYLGVVAMLSMKDDFRLAIKGREHATEEAGKLERIKILDTNVIIDGRVADVCRTGFIEGPIYIPGFVLDEIQHIADSADALKRARGRRGLDILNQMRSELSLIVRSLDARIEPAHNEEVDSKLVKLAKKLDGAIVTNDFNLNKVAELQGVPVLNINELANALKPVVLPGEEMRVTVIKEGKEMNQGVAYLDDGTMIVIEGGRRRIGETLEVVVSSVLQTVAGKMIFAGIKQADEQYNSNDDDGTYDPNPRPYPGSRTRRPLR